MIVRDQQEVTHLKHVIAKLTAQLQHYQHLEPLELQVETEDAVLNMLSGHMLAPMFKEYEAVIQSQKSEIVSLKFELNKVLDENKALAGDNEAILSELTIKTQELLKYVNDYKHLPIQTEGIDYQRI